MIIKQKNSESSHWYTKTGKSAYQVEAKTGEMRATTLRDARKMDLVPSVTTILGVAAKPALNTWLQTQVLLSALTLPRNPNEPEKDWLERVMADSKVQGRQAADRGTAIHGIIESYFDQVYLPEWPQYVRNIDKALIDAFGNQLWLSEKSFAHELGFGGKIDLSAQNLVVDFKTKETPLEKVEPYHEHILQLAAYRNGLNMPNARCAIVFVNGLTNKVKLCEISEEDLADGWECFKHLLSYYKIKNKL
jgi:hypothetical protein